MTVLPRVSPELVVRTFLAAQFGGTVPGLPNARVVTETPADLSAALPLLRVELVSGSSNAVNLDTALLDIEAYATTRDAARTLAEQARVALDLRGPAAHAAGGFIASVTCTTPHWMFYDDTDVRRFAFMARVSVRSVPSPA